MVCIDICALMKCMLYKYSEWEIVLAATRPRPTEVVTWPHSSRSNKAAPLFAGSSLAGISTGSDCSRALRIV